MTRSPFPLLVGLTVVLFLCGIPQYANAIQFTIDEFSHSQISLPQGAAGGTLFLCEDTETNEVTAGLCPSTSTNSDKVLFDTTAGTITMGSDAVGEQACPPCDQPGDQNSAGGPFINPVFHISEPNIETGLGETFIYRPTAGQPGFCGTDNACTYSITSDGRIPEPGTILLLAAGLTVLLIRFRRWKGYT
jgi:hypothetical protein